MSSIVYMRVKKRAVAPATGIESGALIFFSENKSAPPMRLQ